ncbi:MAG: YbhB/YbcL family Raf kinase inhibitor-like protein [Anaerolineaceae bacterium]|nr:YbhB/YbcL family Raf kinase inhibitor-like protein [Anaerolineaceae bacterium]MBN2677929.1 YbhB/YbcL family Raf kinase inhibitor-like protein [Anaerolineaceae bacterium]
MSMHRLSLSVVAVIIVLLAGACVSNSGTGLVISSPDFSDGGVMPEKFTCSGANISPEINWSGAPTNTKSYVLLMEDADGSTGMLTHWIVYDMPVSMILLPARMAEAGKIPGGIMQGTNAFGITGYSGPCPPVGENHQYIFTIYALDAKLDIAPGADIARLKEVMAPRILEQTSITVMYELPAE